MAEHEEELEELYSKLNILDAKCSALLQLSSVILALNIIPAASGELAGLSLKLSMGIAVLFLATSLLSLNVIRIEWYPDEALLKRRTMAYSIALYLTAVGLIMMAALIIISLCVSAV
jgi:hypothetical protein